MTITEIGAIEYIFKKRSSAMSKQLVVSASEADWFQVTISHVLAPLLNPDEDLLQR